jgi:hypothetical protein
MHLSALSAVFKEQPFEEHFLKMDNVRYSTILAEQSIDNQKASDHTLALDPCQMAAHDKGKMMILLEHYFACKWPMPIATKHSDSLDFVRSHFFMNEPLTS